MCEREPVSSNESGCPIVRTCMFTRSVGLDAYRNRLMAYQKKKDIKQATLFPTFFTHTLHARLIGSSPSTFA
jgi:hypothetical protein